MYLGVYGALGLFQAVFVMLGTVVVSVACLNAAIKMHATMLQRILRSPMSFFDTTPLGRILNRFVVFILHLIKNKCERDS